ncbi:MAG: undecaprenyl-diphosphatase UppP [Planctomycetota bacterium]|nr:MAG: undecaprenyl-diphosphatase UppP [Planctomycetota bacterium]
MTLLEAITLGVVQGLTEFLPVSSTAHLRIVPALLGWDDPGAAYSAVIQCGTLAAVCVAMWPDISALTRGFLRGMLRGRPWETPESKVSLLIILGTIPIVIVGLAARKFIKGEARRLEVVIGALVAATLLMAVAELVVRWRARRGSTGRHGLEGVRLADGVGMGLAQVLALVPGTSRSGVTISSGMLAGLDRRTAARFSFLLSLPAVAAAGLLEAWQEREAIFGSADAITTAVAGTLAAAVVGYAAIRWLLSMLGSHTLWPFVVYRLALAGLLAWSLQSGWVMSSGGG